MTLTRFKNKFSPLNLRGLKALKKDQDGMSAVEFALIAPLMVLLYFGGIELSFLMEADRRVTTVSSTIGDLTSRAASLDTDEVGDIFAASNQLILPFDPNTAQLRISSLVADENGAVTVDWSEGCRIVARPPGSTVDDLPNGIVPESGSVIMAEVSYNYQSNIQYLPVTQNINLEDRFFLRPRRTDIITRDTSSGSLPPACNA